jgi:hypothetical protein
MSRMIITFDQFLKNVHVLERIVRCKVFPNFHLERAINKGELHLKIWSIRMKMSKCQKHHDKIPKHVFYQLVKSFFKFPYVLRKKIDFRERKCDFIECLHQVTMETGFKNPLKKSFYFTISM